MIKNICVVTGTRAEYGILSQLIGLINDSPKFNLQLVVTGMHLSDEYGMTVQEIENDGFKIDKKIPILKYFLKKELHGIGA